MFSFFFIVLLYKRTVENASDKNSFRFPEIHLDFIALAQGAGHLIPKKSLGRRAFEQRKGPQGGEFDQKNQKCQMPGGWGMGTLGFDSCNVDSLKIRSYTHASSCCQAQRGWSTYRDRSQPDSVWFRKYLMKYKKIFFQGWQLRIYWKTSLERKCFFYVGE